MEWRTSPFQSNPSAGPGRATCSKVNRPKSPSPPAQKSTIMPAVNIVAPIRVPQDHPLGFMQKGFTRGTLPKDKSRTKTNSSRCKKHFANCAGGDKQFGFTVILGFSLFYQALALMSYERVPRVNPWGASLPPCAMPPGCEIHDCLAFHKFCDRATAAAQKGHNLKGLRCFT